VRTLSSLLGRDVTTEGGRRLGHCHDLRGELQGSRLVVTGVVVGLTGVLERLGVVRRRRPDFVPWEAVVRIDGDRIVVRDGTELT
jgi:sporulation protein YlmC with PRC-barrel domain